jgi:hypothetical protein
MVEEATSFDVGLNMTILGFADLAAALRPEGRLSLVIWPSNPRKTLKSFVGPRAISKSAAICWNAPGRSQRIVTAEPGSVEAPPSGSVLVSWGPWAEPF